MGPPKNGREINVGPKDNLLSHPNLGSRKNKERKIPRFGEDKRTSSTQQKERKKKGKIGAGKISL